MADGAPRGDASGGTLPDPAERGELHVSEKAVRRIAELAVLGVPGVTPRSEREAAPDGAVAGALSAVTSAVGSAVSHEHPRVSADVAGRRCRVDVELSVVWPYPVAEVAAAVRDAVTERVHGLAALDVDGVRVDVVDLRRPAPPAAPRVR